MSLSREEKLLRKRQDYKRNPAPYIARAKNQHYREKYGLSTKKVEAMILERDGRCDLCGEKKKLDVDHSHVTGAIRGLLCRRCNVAIWILDSPLYEHALNHMRGYNV